jgi:hypothetical protein
LPAKAEAASHIIVKHAFDIKKIEPKFEKSPWILIIKPEILIQ